MNTKFTLSEILELEALELRGGTGADGSHLQCPCSYKEKCVKHVNCTHSQCPC